MAPWILPTLIKVLPHVRTIYDTAAPMFTKKPSTEKPNAASDGALLQQQIAELQAAAAQNAANVKELAAQLQGTVTALQEGAALAERRLRRATLVAAASAAFSACAVIAAVVALFLSSSA